MHGYVPNKMVLTDASLLKCNFFIKCFFWSVNRDGTSILIADHGRSYIQHGVMVLFDQTSYKYGLTSLHLY